MKTKLDETRHVALSSKRSCVRPWFRYIRYLFIYFDCCYSIWFFWLWLYSQVNDRVDIFCRHRLARIYLSQLCQFYGLRNRRNALFCVSFFRNEIYYNLSSCVLVRADPIYRCIVPYKYKAIIIIQCLNLSYLCCKPLHSGCVCESILFCICNAHVWLFWNRHMTHNIWHSTLGTPRTSTSSHRYAMHTDRKGVGKRMFWCFSYIYSSISVPFRWWANNKKHEFDKSLGPHVSHNIFSLTFFLGHRDFIQ